MPCAEHPSYTGQRRPRTGCKECLKIYENAHAKAGKAEEKTPPPAKPSKSANKKAAPEAPPIEKELIPPAEPIIKPVTGHPNRGSYLAPNDYRKDVVSCFSRWFPQYRIRTNSDASIIELEDVKMERALWWNVWSRNLIDPSRQKTKAELLKELKSKEVTVTPGNVYFLEELQTVLMVVSFNVKEGKVFLREWHTQDLVTMKIKDFEAARPRDLIFSEDLVQTKQTIKVLTV